MNENINMIIMKINEIIFALFMVSFIIIHLSFSLDFYSYNNESSIEDLSQYIKVNDIVYGNNITYVYIQNTYTSTIIAEYVLVKNISINYTIVNVTHFYNNVSYNVSDYVYNDTDNSFKAYNLTLPIGESILIIKGPNSTTSTPIISNVFILPEDQNYTSLVNNTVNFSFSVNSYSDENYTVNISVYLNGTKIYNFTNENITGYSKDFVINFTLNNSGIKHLLINCTSNLTEYIYSDNIRNYYINVTMPQINNPPIINIYSPINNSLITDSNNVLINFSVFDDDLYSAYWEIKNNNSIVLLSGNSVDPVNYTNITFLPNGNYTLSVSGIDYGNNYVRKDVNFLVNYVPPNNFNPPPEITVYSPKNIAYNTTDILINLSVEDNNFYKMYIQIFDLNNNLVYNKTTSDEDYSDSISLNVGNYTLKVLALDEGGKTDYKEVPFSIILPPSNVSLKVYLENGTIIRSNYYNVSYEIFGYVPENLYNLSIQIYNENQSKVMYTLPETNLNNYVLNFSNLSNGKYYINFSLYENGYFVDSDNKWVILNISSIVNNTPPEIMIYSPRYGQYYEENVPIYVTVNDTNLKEYNLKIYNKNGILVYQKQGNSSDVVRETLDLEEGEYNLTVFAEDIYGLTSKKSVNFNVFRKSVPSPSVKILSPQNDQIFEKGKINVSFTIDSPYLKNAIAYLKYPDGSIKSVYEYDIDGDYILPLSLDMPGRYYFYVIAKNKYDKSAQDGVFFIYKLDQYLENSAKNVSLSNDTINILIKSPELNKEYLFNQIPISFTINNSKDALMTFKIYDQNNFSYFNGTEYGKYWNYVDVKNLEYDKQYYLKVTSYIPKDNVYLTKKVPFKVTYLDYYIKKIYKNGSSIYVTFCTNKLNRSLNYNVFINNINLKSGSISFNGNSSCLNILVDKGYYGKFNITAMITSEDSNISNNKRSKVIVFNSPYYSSGSVENTPENSLYLLFILIFGILFVIWNNKRKN